MSEKNTDIDAEQVLSTCYKCETVPDKSCTECGNLFCSNHGGERYIWKDGGNSFAKKMVCDDCTPNQTIMKIKKYLLIIVMVLIGLFILSIATYLFFFMDDSISSPSSPTEPAPTETVDPVEEETMRIEF